MRNLASIGIHLSIGGVTLYDNLKIIGNYKHIKSVWAINLQLSWPRGPILWEMFGYIYMFVHATYEPGLHYMSRVLGRNIFYQMQNKSADLYPHTGNPPSKM